MNINYQDYQDTAVSGGMVSLLSSGAIQPFSTAQPMVVHSLCQHD